MTDRRWAWVEIDTSAITSNVRTLKALTAPGTLFMAVVKADGYGHGAVRVARAALEGGADRLGVATVAEAIELRDAGFTVPIQILSEPPEKAIPQLIDRGITPTVTTREFALALGKTALARGTESGYHLKIDTGMGRIGVRAEDATEFVRALDGFPGLRLEGVMTHFATADVAGDWDAVRQLQRFREVLSSIRDEGIDPGIVHAANSPATILIPESHFSMVRCGIAIYGLQPSDDTAREVDLVPAMSVKGRFTLVKRIGMGDGVSYGLTWQAAAPTVIGTLPLGYADGVHRVLSNRFKVLVDGQLVPQIGRVCMDQFMVELPRGVEAKRGSEAVLVGAQGERRITMEQLAETAGTINYELACSFGMRMERVYL